MEKKCTLLLILPFILLNARTNNEEQLFDLAKEVQNDFSLSENQFANYVSRRYYFVTRLEQTMSLFFAVQRSLNQNLKTKKSNINQLFDFESIDRFKHKKIVNSLKEISSTRSLKPLFIVWDEFVRYKSIDDQLLIEDFTKEIFLISRNIVLSRLGEKRVYEKNLPPTLKLALAVQPQEVSIGQLLDIIDFYVDHLKNNFPEYAPISTPKARYMDIKPLAHIDDITAHFYHLKRLSKAFWYLHKNMDIKMSRMQLAECNTIRFKSKEVISCLRIMNQTQTITPLIELIAEMNRYKHVESVEFTKEVSLLILIVLKNNPKSNRTRVTVQNLIALYQTMEALPIEEILGAIDILTEELPLINEKYELDSELTWKEWFKKYWWAPPLIATTIGIRVFFLIKSIQDKMKKTS